MKTFVAIVLLGAGLLLSGCGEQISDQTQKAVEQIKAEASKLAAKQIETFKTDTVGQLKKLQGESGKETSDEKSADKPSDSTDK